MEHVDQNSESLRYGLFDKVVDLNQFTIIEYAKWNFVNWATVFPYVLGESHAFEIYFADGTSLTELFSCSKVHPEGSLFDDEKKDEYFHETDNYKYTFVRWNSQTPISVLGAIKPISFKFPDQSITLLNADKSEDDGAFSLMTNHVYPKENIIIKSRTIIEKKDNTRC